MKLLIAIIALVLPVAALGAEPPKKREKPAAEAETLRLVDHAEIAVVRGALSTLTDVAPESIPNRLIPKLTKIALESPDTKAREHALQVLGTMGPRAGSPNLWKRLTPLLDVRRKTPPGRIRGWAAWVIGKTGAPVDEYGLTLIGAMHPFDDFTRAAAEEAFGSLSGDVAKFLRIALRASEPDYIRSRIVLQLAMIEPSEGGLSADEARALYPTAHSTERPILLGVASANMTGKPHEIEFIRSHLNAKTGLRELNVVLRTLTDLGPKAAPLAPYVCELYGGSDRVPSYSVLKFFEAIGPEPEAMCIVPRLEDPDSPYLVADILAGLGSPGLAMLIKWLKSGEGDRRTAALYAMSKLEAPWPAFHAVLEVLRDPSSKQRPDALRVLAKLGEPGQYYIRKHLKDEDEAVRASALDGLRGDGAMDLLLVALREESGAPAMVAAKRFAELESSMTPEERFDRIMAANIPLPTKLDRAAELRVSVLPLFQKMVRSDLAETRQKGVTVAYRLVDQPDEVVPELARLLDDEDREVRFWAASCLKTFGPSAAAAVPALRSALLDEHSVQYAAVEALGAIGPMAAAARPELLEMLDRRATGTVIQAIARLGDVDQKTIDKFLEILRTSKDSYHRTAIARALGDIPTDDAREALREALDDPDEHVRWAAAKSLSRSGDAADRERAKATLDKMGSFPPMRNIERF